MIQNEAMLLKGNEMVQKTGKMLFVGSAVLILLSGAICIFYKHIELYTQDKQPYSGTPDVVSSRTEGDECVLIVVANAERIEDEEKFAEETVRIYEENTFYTTRFSRDQTKILKKVYMSVYLQKSDIGHGPALFTILYDTESGRTEIIE